MKSHHDFDSTVSLESLSSIWKHFSILNKYVLHAPGPGQRSYHSCPGGFSISIDALEAGLRFPLHPVIGECLGWWRISPGFRVRGAPSNNNGWKARFLFVSRHRGWDFSVKWSADPVSNVPPNLSDEDTKLIGRLKGILSMSRAIRSLTEEWLVEAGLSPASRAASSIPDSAPPASRAESGSTSEVQEIPIEEARGAPEVSCKRRGEDPISQRKKDWRKSPHKADRVVVKGKGPTDVSEEPMAPRQKLMLVREL
ncbi:hypothetical protein GW17_00026488 [Ensete ventricosum]|nr:hypothetical protein GW17_00026488 [Ensete ventricosum]